MAHDVESDLHRFHHTVVDFDEDVCDPLVPPYRLFEWIERLAAYDGAVAARIHALQEEAKKRSPSRDALSKPGVTATDTLGPDPDMEYETV